MRSTSTAARRRRATRARVAGSTIAAAEFKARCLELMDRVSDTGVEYIVTKHRKPVAKLVPYRSLDKRGVFGSMKGTVLRYERPFDSVDGDWDVYRG